MRVLNILFALSMMGMIVACENSKVKKSSAMMSIECVDKNGEVTYKETRHSIYLEAFDDGDATGKYHKCVIEAVK